MTKEKRVLAVFAADIHLSLKPPIARSAESCWLTAQDRILDQIDNLTQSYDAPLVIAGDVFDRPNQSPELVNRLIHRWGGKRRYAIPGQHDLNHHRLENIHATSFWTLVESGAIQYLRPGHPIEPPTSYLPPIRLHGFPWGSPIKPLENPHDLTIEVAVVHAYCWTKMSGYEDAPEDCYISVRRDSLEGYDVAVIGDNHKPFASRNIYGCGALIPRKADERKHVPSVGLLLPDGTIERHYLDVSKDKWLEPDALEAIKRNPEVERYVRMIEATAEITADFESDMKKALEGSEVPGSVRREILKAIEESKGGE